MDKRILGILSYVLLATVGLLTVPLGIAEVFISPIVGIVIIVIGGLIVGLAVVIGGKIDQPQRRHRPTTHEEKLTDR